MAQQNVNFLISKAELSGSKYPEANHGYLTLEFEA
jgi:hypothetical protein